MDKETRHNLIVSIHRKLKGYKPQVITAHRSEIKEETRLAAVHNDDQSIIDEGVEVRVISPALAAIVKTPTHAKHAAIDECLTTREHAELAKDLAEYRKTHPRPPSYSKRLWLWIMPADPFETMKRAEVVSCQTVNA